MNHPQALGRTLTDAQLLALTVEQLNAGARSYRWDLRYSREDVRRYAELWNQRCISTQATTVSIDGVLAVVVVDLPGIGTIHPGGRA